VHKSNWAPRYTEEPEAEVSKRFHASKAKGSNVHDFFVVKNTVEEEVSHAASNCKKL
jgi:hypothetical protein